MKSIAALASILFFNGGVSNGKEVTATFGTNTDISGEVTVEGGSISVDISLSNLNSTMLPPNCTVGGLRYHVHSEWNYNDTNDRLGPLECGSAYTGGHYDPWVACSSSSSNEYCNVNGGCVNGSSVTGDVGSTTYYSCNETNFDSNPYTCEVGDWSGKYGYLQLSDTLEGSLEGDSAFEVDAKDLIGMSIVFHCNDNTRAFCAPFVVTDESNDDDRVEQDEFEDRQVLFDELGAGSAITLENDGHVIIDLDLESLIIPDGCGDYLYYRVYNSWNQESVTNSTTRRRLLQEGVSNTTGAPLMNTTSGLFVENTTSVMAEPTSSPTSMPTMDCADLVGEFYDPTVTCAPGTEHTDYCKGPSNGKLCGDATYSYSCTNGTADRFNCAPGDLSGKYGVIDLRLNNTDIFIEAYDDLMISLELLEGKSAVLQCSDSLEIVTCGEWIAVESGSSGSKNNGTPVWVWIVVAIGAVLLIAGAIFLCRKCRSDGGEYSRIQSK